MRINRGLTCVAPLASLLGRQDISQPDQDLPELFPEEESGTNSLEDQGFSDWPEAGGPRLTKWEEAGRMPEGCYQTIMGEGNIGGTCDLATLEVYDVHFDDCEDQPWTICRCSTADKDINKLVEDLGQLPVYARDYVRYVVMSDHVMIDGQSALEAISLYTQGDLVIYGNWSSVGLFVHETTHTLDYWVAGEGEASYSDSDEWKQIVDNDTCVADWYSKSAYGEAYAQGAVLVAFDINKSGPLEDIVDYSCASGVHSLIKSQLGEYLKYDADAKCRDRIPKNQDVCIQDNGDALYCEDDTDSSNSDDSNGGDDSDSDDNGDNGDNGSSASRANVLAIFRLIAKVLRVTGLLHNQ